MIVPLFDRNQGNIRAAEGEVRIASQELERIDRALRRDLAEVYGRYASSAASAERFQREIIPEAAQFLQLIREAFAAGQVTYDRVWDAQRLYSETNGAYLDAWHETWVAREEILGLLAVEGLDPASE
jgi:cobalt-zinc-cadmium efflux system outer membrane protein